MAERTFGWVQEAYTINNLKNVVAAFVLDSEINRLLRFDKLPRLIQSKAERESFINELSRENMRLPYTHLKGKGTPKGCTRSNAPCSGIVQAILKGQKKEYQSDWPADSFLRWAISIGFLEYDRELDSCTLSPMGRRYAEEKHGSSEETKLLTEALISYPPVCRVLALLDKYGHLTKFEMGAQTGFIGEAGFTAIPQRMIIQGLAETESAEERRKLLQDTEGTSDKYVRTICSWLQQMGWVKQVEKAVTVRLGSGEYTGRIGQAYCLTLQGKTVLKYSSGKSKYRRIPKRVMWDMLATKAADRDYLRNRRTFILKYISNNYRSASEIVLYLKSKGIEEAEETVEDDISGFINIGLDISCKSGAYKLADEICGLDIPEESLLGCNVKSDITQLKDLVRKRLVNVNHKYLILLDLGFDGKADRDYEIQTAELLTEELQFKGARLGDTRKPDVCVYYKENGLIIDNKAYGKGYSLPIKQADEMYRYLEENRLRDRNLNPNEWWKIFGEGVCRFNYAFVSGEFTGGFKERLENICLRSGIRGASINSLNLLLLAEELKSGRMSYEDSFRLFDSNDEIKILPVGSGV